MPAKLSLLAWGSLLRHVASYVLRAEAGEALSMEHSSLPRTAPRFRPFVLFVETLCVMVVALCLARWWPVMRGKAMALAKGSEESSSGDSNRPLGQGFSRWPMQRLQPTELASRAFTTSNGEVHVHDVFGLPSTIKRHVMQLTVVSDALLTLQVEVHRDTPSTLAVDVYGRGDSGKGGRRVLWGRNMLGAGGEDTKAFVHGLLSQRDHEVDIVFDLVSVDVEASQVDSTVAEAKCWPVRVDLTAVPTARAGLYWPTACPSEDRLPKPLDAAVGSQVVVLGDRGLSAGGTDAGHFVFRFSGERPWMGFQRSLWSGTLEVPPRLHRFVRLFLRSSFRFASGPLQV
eukprot:s896_g9.t1